MEREQERKKHVRMDGEMTERGKNRNDGWRQDKGEGKRTKRND